MGAIYSISITSLNVLLVPSEFPQVVLSVEKTELGISAGLQDRVIQTYGGLVHMDFTGSVAESESPYTKLSPALLPSMYLAYNTATGGESGAVHNTVRSRWEQRDPELVDGMRVLGTIATALWM
jgi:glucuronokinase